MVRILIALLVLFVAMLYTPLWLQIALYIVAVIITPHRILLLIPAVFADVYYAPTEALSLYNLKTTLFVGGLLVVHFIIMTKTRVGLLYGVSKK